MGIYIMGALLKYILKNVINDRLHIWLTNLFFTILFVRALWRLFKEVTCSCFNENVKYTLKCAEPGGISLFLHQKCSWTIVR